MIAGLAIAASAQKDGQERPPKDPPVINPGKPGPKPTPQPTPPKKPNYAIVLADIGVSRYTV